ncbi:sigma factor-like helix-turn-helix DNA-binding protein [Caulobacter sp. UC70_42]|uniref:sigma factor-like helix-turn-helix DNA-binding protein n=1 Tax=Caulobacter sp. UC70_42 TaxID=3374551 RepID=UPI0037569BDB
MSPAVSGSGPWSRPFEDLPEKTRQAFRLHKLEGHSHVETARRMGISVSTVEKHISSALKTLTRRLR